MKPFEINLARDYTAPLQKRKRNYWLMIAYLCACGLLLIYTAYETAQTLNTVRKQKIRLSALRESFLQKYPQAESIQKKTEELQETLDQKTRTAQNLLNAFSAATPLAECLYRFVEPLPENMHLQQLSMQPERENQTVQLTFYLPAATDRQQSDPAVWIRKWKADPSISRLLTNITLTDRKNNEKRGDAQVTEFTCTAELNNRHGEF